MSSLLSDDQDVLRDLRALTPARPLSYAEARSLAERQAQRLLELLYIDAAPVPMFAISSLPGVSVERRRNWPTSGMSVPHDGGWRIVLNASEPRQRQRFTLAHEFKHVVDDPFYRRHVAHLTPERQRERSEDLCNYFAACLMMPRTWIKRDWCAGIQSPRDLARRYFMSEAAMRTRLIELGLLPAVDTALPVARHPAPWSRS